MKAPVCHQPNKRCRDNLPGTKPIVSPWARDAARTEAPKVLLASAS
jgi:hypothetical protein